MKGYIKDHRRELESDIWLMPPLYHRVWQWLKYKANHEDREIPMKDGSRLLIRRGQHLTSLRQIAQGVGWYEGMKWKEPNPKTISSILSWMEKQQMIRVERGNGNRQYTLITLLNWDSYQMKDDEGNSKETVRKQSGKQKTDINKNDYINNIVPTEQPGGASELPNKKQVIAEMVAVYRSIPGVEPRKADYSFLGQLFNEYGPGEVYGAIKALERKMESGPVSDTYSYLRATARAKAAEAAAKVTPLRRQPQTQHPLIPPGYNMPSLEDLERQRQVEAEMEAIRQERLRRRREMNGA